jgi:HlyD family secretion protein
MSKQLYIVPLLFFILSCGNRNSKEVPVAEVRQGVFFLDIHEEGDIKAVNSINISAPNMSWRYGSLKITQLIEDGKDVHAGDTVVVFDPSEVRKAIVESEASVEMKQAELKKLKAEQESAIVELEADLEITKLSQEISKIRLESASYEADIKRKEIELNLEKANIALERAIEQIANRKKIQEEELKQKMLEINQSENQLDEANETMSMLYLVSPSPGIAILTRNWSSDAKFQVGDQCWSGFTLVELPDLSELKASVLINEVDISKIKQGLRVEIKPDAFSDSIYEGEVISVANLAINKDRNSKIKVFPVEILLKTKSNKLMPGLTVSCRIIVDQIDDVMYIPREALHSTPDHDFVYVQTATGFEKQNVTLGKSNTDFVIVASGLTIKDKVALVDPFAQLVNSEINQ